jgi:antitoxin component YwqK of YwqJK toxin-antitoxin module
MQEDSNRERRPKVSPATWFLAFAITALGGWWISQQQQPAPVEVERELLLSLVSRSNDMMFASGATEPFTGSVVEYYKNGQLKSKTEVAEGKLQGVSHGYFTNGQMQVEEFFTNGVSHGVRKKWHMNGTLLSEGEIMGGKFHGAFKKYHENGKLAQEVMLSNGVPHGVSRAWDTNGTLLNTVEMRNGEKVGEKAE